MSRYIWIKSKRYYYYDTYSNYQDARNMGKKLKRKNPKCQYFILPVEKGFIVPFKIYKLYTTKFSNMSLW